MGRLILSFLLLLSILSAFAAPAQSQPTKSGTAPPQLMALLPEGGANASGVMNAAGGMGLASLACDLPAKYPCVSEKYPVRVRIALQFHASQELIDLQAGPMQAQDMANQTAEFQRRLKGVTPGKARVLRVDALKTEPAPGGSLVRYDYVVDCSEETHRERPYANLHAVSRNGLALLSLDIAGVATAKEAVAIANGVMGRFVKGDFSTIVPRNPE